MRKLACLLCLLALPAMVSGADDLGKGADRLSRAEMQSVIELMGHDLLEGRAPGTRGGELAEIYLQSMFKWMGLQPGQGAGYYQPFALKGFQTKTLNLAAGEKELKYLEDVVGSSTSGEAAINLQGELVFAGFGIRTPIWDWDDFKDADLRGKILLVRVNDPGLFLPDVFEGKSLTYFGRWRCKIEEAGRTGAAAILLIHTDETAGYGWTTVQNSWSGESLHLPSALQTPLKFQGWIREAPLRQLLARQQVDLDALYRRSLQRDFRPVPLGFPVRLQGESEARDLIIRNVLGEIPGSSDRRIVISAHSDHLGIDPRGGPEAIYNGAIDNGSAVAAMLLVAKVLRETGWKPRHTITFLACHAEEEGLLGSQYYVETADRQKIAANINFESSPVWEASPSIMGVGAEYSTLEDDLQAIARAQNWQLSRFSMTDQGFFFRSDQFPFASFGIPAIWLSAGETTVTGDNRLRNFFKGNYHTGRDDFDPAWPLEGLRQTVKAALLLLERLDAADAPPRYRGRLPFPVREERPRR